ncbi:MAG: hypothetical protein QXR92_02580 [Fervidicoccaceae archaeon]
MKYTEKIELIVLALLPILLVGALTIPTATAQTTGGATIVSATGTASDGNAYPGEPITVTIQVNLAGGYTVELANDTAGKTVWASQTFNAPTTGTYTITLTLPLSLPNLTSPPAVYILLTGPFTNTSTSLKVYPKIVITPIQTAVVDQNGNPINATVNIYGATPSSIIYSLLFTGPSTWQYVFSTPLTVKTDGTNTTTLILSGPNSGLNSTTGIPRGTYSVTFYNVAGLNYTDYAKPGTITILPVLLITPNNGNGIDSDLTSITLTGYSFDPNVNIAGVNFTNTNFTNVFYYFDFTTLSSPKQTDNTGYWTFSNLYNVFPTNMTAGLYTLNVVETPISKTETASHSNVQFGTDTLTISSSTIYNDVGTHATVTATFNIAGSWAYQKQTAAQSYTKTETLKIDFTSGGYTYEITGMLYNATAVMFALYNLSASPTVQIFSQAVNTTWDSSINANVSALLFNVTSTGITNATGSATGTFLYQVIFYNYTNLIQMELDAFSFVPTNSTYTVTYNNTDTGTVKTFTGTLTFSNGAASASIPSFTDAGISWSISVSVTVPLNATTYNDQLTVTMTPTGMTYLPFPNTYYLVRPILIVTPTSALPGSTLTITAYGYGPGAAWGYSGKNTLTVSLDRTVILATVTLGKDGNLTFTVTLPSTNIPFGAHYIWGRDAWGYEYSAAIIIGSKGYFEIVNPLTGLPKTVPNAYAGYNNATLTVCPCGQYTGLKFCDQCAVYNGGCDYVGDQISVFLNGLNPGETVTIYFGSIPIATATADSTGAASATFVVPTVPQGSYSITATGASFGTLTLQFFNTTAFYNSPVNVVPKLLLLDLNTNAAPVLVGPGIVRVIGTGFTPGVSILSVLFNGTDAVMALTTNVERWSANANGLLVSPFTSTLGLYIPVLEPGAYAISFAYALGTTINSTDPGYVYVINNLTKLATVMDVNAAVSNITNAVNSAASSLSSAISSVSSQLTTLQNNLNSAVQSLNSAISNVGTAVSGLQNSLNSMAATVNQISTQVGTINTAVNNLASQLSTISTQVSSMSSKIDTAVSAAQSAATNAQNAANSASTAASAVNALSSKIDSAVSAAQSASSAAANASSAAASASSNASNALYVSIITLILVLVAIAITFVVYSTLKKSLATTAAPSK